MTNRLYHFSLLFLLIDTDFANLSIVLPRLKRLKFLCIDGTPIDLQNFRKLIATTPNLTTLSMRFDCLLKLLEDEDQSLQTYHLLNHLVDVLCIRFEETRYLALSSEHIHFIARIFHAIHRLAIDTTDSKIIIDVGLMSVLLNSFPRLTVLSIYGESATSYTETILKDELMALNSTRWKHRDDFKVDCGHQRIKIWL